MKSSGDPIKVDVIQSSPVVYWAESQPMLVVKELNMTFRSNGVNLIELDECGGRAITNIYSTFGALNSSSSVIQQFRKSNNIIWFNYHGAVFIQAKTGKATYRWFEYDRDLSKGVGYDEYESGWLRVLKTSANVLEVSAEPLKFSEGRSPSSIIVAVEYEFYAAKEEGELYSIMNCGQEPMVSAVTRHHTGAEAKRLAISKPNAE